MCLKGFTWVGIHISKFKYFEEILVICHLTTVKVKSKKIISTATNEKRTDVAIDKIVWFNWSCSSNQLPEPTKHNSRNESVLL